MGTSKNSSGQRSNLYSAQRFTNWTPHDPFWSEAEALPTRLRPRAKVNRSDEVALPIYDRKLSPGFLRPLSVQDLVETLHQVPSEFISGLESVYLLGGTEAQRQTKKFVYGMYSQCRIYLFPFAQNHMQFHWKSTPKPNISREFTKFGATIIPSKKGGADLHFEQESLRLFYLYDVLLHEIGHHVDPDHRSQSAERYANWFADYQRARLREIAAEDT